MARKNNHVAWCQSLAGQSIGNYKLLEFVRAGRIGFVYKAELAGFEGAPFAIKLVFDRLHTGWEQELKKVMKLQVVDSVVHFHKLDTGQISKDGKTKLCQYTVWDFISPGQDLKRYLRRHEKIPTSFAFAVVERILRVLHYCERNGVARHGDLHAGNILIGDESNSRIDDQLQIREPIYVSDFGYGTTGAATQPKDDYAGIAQIFN